MLLIYDNKFDGFFKTGPESQLVPPKAGDIRTTFEIYLIYRTLRPTGGRRHQDNLRSVFYLSNTTANRSRIRED
jgi:hypothetical protein